MTDVNGNATVSVRHSTTVKVGKKISPLRHCFTKRFLSQFTVLYCYFVYSQWNGGDVLKFI